MDFTGRNEHVDAWFRGALDRLPRLLDVLRVATRQAGDAGVADLARDGGDRFEIAGGGCREAGLDDVDPELVERTRDTQFLAERHAASGRLLTVAERRVENADAVVVFAGHSDLLAASRRAPTGVGVTSPARASCLAALRRPSRSDVRGRRSCGAGTRAVRFRSPRSSRARTCPAGCRRARPSCSP